MLVGARCSVLGVRLANEPETLNAECRAQGAEHRAQGLEG